MLILLIDVILVDQQSSDLLLFYSSFVFFLVCKCYVRLSACQWWILHSGVITVCVMGEVKYLPWYSLKAWLCDGSVIQERFFLMYNLPCILMRFSSAFVFHTCFIFPHLNVYFWGNFCVSVISRFWRRRRSWAGIQDGKQAGDSSSKQRLCPTTQTKTRTRGEWKWLRESVYQVLQTFLWPNKNSSQTAA